MFSLTPEELLTLIDPKSIDKLNVELNGVQGLAEKLKTNLQSGLQTTHVQAHTITVFSSSSDSNNTTTKPSSSKFNSTSSSHFNNINDPLLERRKFYGINQLPPPPSKTFLQFIWDALHDKTLIVLMIAAAMEISIGIYKMISADDSLAIVDGVAILIAVVIVVLVGAVNDYKKQAQFRSLNDFSKGLTMTKVIRDGVQQQILNTDLLVGDLVILETGDIIPADGVYASGYNLETDESSLTGESHAVKKNSFKDPFLLSGTKVLDGMGKMIVIGVGIHSLNGRTLLTLQVEPEETPLQHKLSKLADSIARFGLMSAAAMIIMLIIAYVTVIPPSSRNTVDIANDMINVLISAVTLIVVAVPEGLPMAVTLALAHATLQMLKDQNLVRHLSACETMGNATTICSDKTGTLTMNKMTVVKASLMLKSMDLHHFNPDFGKSEIISEHQQKIFSLVAQAININSTATETVNDEGITNFSGSKTEVALLEMTKKLGFDYHQHRQEANVIQVIPFSSARKSMTTVVEKQNTDVSLETNLDLDLNKFYSHNSLTNGDHNEMGNKPSSKRYYVFTKGASEIILSRCTSYLSPDGVIQNLDANSRKLFEDRIADFANDALRTIAVGFKLYDKMQYESTVDVEQQQLEKKHEHRDSLTDSSFILMGIFGIQDPVRPEVPEAVRSCQRAGVVVRMVTGDNVATARSIARDCGILTEGGIVMEGPEFRQLNSEQMAEIVPRLQVLARSSPQDKQILVNCLKALGETVAVTGDGTNDAPALKAADVGFSMGIAGTEVAKEASDIVLMDDNFASLVKAVVWGRSVYDSVRKFLQFQLTVNVVT